MIHDSVHQVSCFAPDFDLHGTRFLAGCKVNDDSESFKSEIFDAFEGDDDKVEDHCSWLIRCHMMATDNSLEISPPGRNGEKED